MGEPGWTGLNPVFPSTPDRLGVVALGHDHREVATAEHGVADEYEVVALRGLLDLDVQVEQGGDVLATGNGLKAGVFDGDKGGAFGLHGGIPLL